MSIASKKIPFMEVNTMADLVALRSTLSQAPKVRNEILGVPVQTVVLDTIDEIQAIAIDEILRREKKDALAIQDWGKVADEMKAVIRGFRNLDMNVIFTCHLKLVTDEDSGRSWYAPGLQGQIADKIPGYVDLSLLIRSVTVTQAGAKGSEKVTKRILESSPTKQYPFLKDRSGKLPVDFTVNFEDDYERINDYIFSGIDDVPETESITEMDTDPQPADDLPTLTKTQRAEAKAFKNDPESVKEKVAAAQAPATPEEEKKTARVATKVVEVKPDEAEEEAVAPVMSSAVLSARKLRGA